MARFSVDENMPNISVVSDLRHVHHSSVIKQKLKLYSFEWSFRPLLLFHKILGLPLKFELSPSYSTSKCLCWLQRMLCFLPLFLNFVLHFWMIGNELSRTGPTKTNTKVYQTSSTVFWNYRIELLDSAVTIIGAHALLIYLSNVSWCHLSEVLLIMELQNLYTDEEYRKFRMIFWVGAALFIAVSEQSGVIIHLEIISFFTYD